MSTCNPGGVYNSFYFDPRRLSCIVLVFLNYIYTICFYVLLLFNFSTDKIYICHYRLCQLSCGAFNISFSSISHSFPAFVYLFLFLIFPSLIRHSITILFFIFFIPYWTSYLLTWAFHIYAVYNIIDTTLLQDPTSTQLFSFIIYGLSHDHTGQSSL